MCLQYKQLCEIKVKFSDNRGMKWAMKDEDKSLVNIECTEILLGSGHLQ